MPPISTIPNVETDEFISETTAAFQIINDINDDPTGNSNKRLLNDLHTIPIKPLPTRTDLNLQSEKPNVIVYPTRRELPQNGNLDKRQKNFTRSNGYIYTQTRNVGHSTLLKNGNSISYGNLSGGSTNLKNKSNILDFNSNLDAKLRKLQDYQEPNRISPQNKSRQDLRNDDRKPFVTVVKKGTFLRPPPNVAQKLLLEPEPDDSERNEKVHIAKKLYAYVSRPRILNRDSAGKKKDKSLCSSAEKNLQNRNLKNSPDVSGISRVKREANGDWKIQR